MTNLAFDTYSAVKELEQAGMPVKQAESVVETLRKSREFDVSHLATKMDLKDTKVALDKKIDGVKSELKVDINALDKKIDGVKSELKVDINALDKKIDGVKSELKGDIAGLKVDIAGLKVDIAGLQIGMIKWIVPLMLGQTALVVALIKFLQHSPLP